MHALTLKHGSFRHESLRSAAPHPYRDAEFFSSGNLPLMVLPTHKRHTYARRADPAPKRLQLMDESLMRRHLRLGTPQFPAGVRKNPFADNHRSGRRMGNDLAPLSRLASRRRPRG